MNGRIKSLIAIFVLLVLSSIAVFSLTEKQISPSGNELISPSDWVKEEQIKIYRDRIILDIKNSNWTGFTDTNSMDPFIDEKANAIEILPENPTQIKAGDVISYQSEYGIIIHRVIGVGEDDEGIYYIAKGDNNQTEDPLKVRFSDIKGVVVAVVY